MFLPPQRRLRRHSTDARTRILCPNKRTRRARDAVDTRENLFGRSHGLLARKIKKHPTPRDETRENTRRRATALQTRSGRSHCVAARRSYYDVYVTRTTYRRQYNQRALRLRGRFLLGTENDVCIVTIARTRIYIHCNVCKNAS